MNAHENYEAYLLNDMSFTFAVR